MLLRFCVAQRRAAKHTFVKKKERGVFSESGFGYLSEKNERSNGAPRWIEDEEVIGEKERLWKEKCGITSAGFNKTSGCLGQCNQHDGQESGPRCRFRSK